jgi:hypothetical protein
MAPSIALLVWLVLLVALFRFDPAKERGVSVAIWVPLLWIIIVASRLPSQWLGGDVERAAGAMQEGSALDRIVYTTLIFLAFAVLATRGFNWARFFRANVVLTAFLAYALMSVAWSDFPFISFKRWFRDLGLYVVILVVLSDPKPFEAIGTLHRRLYYLLIPLCILLNKYFPWIAREFDPWTGKGYYMGATTSKNMLGVLCLASGMFFFWDTLIRWKDRKDRRTQRILAVNAAFLAMTLWLMSEAGSATSNVTLVLGCLVIAVAHSATFNRRPMLLAVMIPTGVALYLLLEFGFGIHDRTLASSSGGARPVQEDEHLEGRSRHQHQSAHWGRLRKLLARTPAAMGVGTRGRRHRSAQRIPRDLP